MIEIRPKSKFALAASAGSIAVLVWITGSSILYSNQLDELRSASAAIGAEGALTMMGPQHCTIIGLPPRTVCSSPTTITVPVKEEAKLDYPTAMRVNQSGEVRLVYTVHGSTRERLEFEAKVQKATVSGAGFSVEPEETRALGPAESLAWSIRAASTGPHNLIVNTAEFFRLPSATLTVSGTGDEPVLEASAGELVLPVMIYTIWNIPDWAAKIIGWCVALGAFILTVPFLQDIYAALVARLDKTTSNDPGSSGEDPPS